MTLSIIEQSLSNLDVYIWSGQRFWP